MSHCLVAAEDWSCCSHSEDATMHERDIFLEALEHHSLDERDSFLDRTCAGDAQLRSRVELLLKSHEEADSLLDHPVLGDAPTEVGAGAPIDRNRTVNRTRRGDVRLPRTVRPTRLARTTRQYDVREVVGHGGMGIVSRPTTPNLAGWWRSRCCRQRRRPTPQRRKRFLREAGRRRPSVTITS